MSRKWAIISIVIVIAAIISIVLLSVMALAFVDWWPPHGDLEAISIANNTEVFAVPFDVPGADGPVKFENCAINFQINNQSLGPTDYSMNPGPYSWAVRTTHGSGYLNALVFMGGAVSYVFVLNDVDSDGFVTEGDTISLIASEPFHPATYSIVLITELSSSWSPGTFTGSFTA
jgi:hypothetical protein